MHTPQFIAQQNIIRLKHALLCMTGKLLQNISIALVKQVNFGVDYFFFVSGQPKMWVLLPVTTLLSVLGVTHGLFGKLEPTSPEVHMNIVSYWGKQNLLN